DRAPDTASPDARAAPERRIAARALAGDLAAEPRHAGRHRRVRAGGAEPDRRDSSLDGARGGDARAAGAARATSRRVGPVRWSSHEAPDTATSGQYLPL